MIDVMRDFGQFLYWLFIVFGVIFCLGCTIAAGFLLYAGFYVGKKRKDKKKKL